MTTIVTRSGKGSSLSWSEVDTNFTNLNTDKAETDSPTFTGTVSGITKEMIGLGNVDNTSDVNKPISTATQTSLDLKVPKDSDTGAATLPSGTTAQRPSTGVGKVRFNSTIGIYEGYNTATSSWESLGSIVNTQTVGVSSTASENHFWDGSVANQLTLKRGTPASVGSTVLQVVNGVVTTPLQTGPAFMATGTTGAVPLGDTQITFTETLDTDACFASSKFTPNVAGLYQINLYLATNIPSTETSGAKIAKNGTAVAIQYQNGTVGGGGGFYSVSTIVQMNGTTDYITGVVGMGVGGYSLTAASMQGALIRKT